MTTATLDWSLTTECPKCYENFDLATEDYENTISNAIFNNRWDSLRGLEVTCPECLHEFKLTVIEY